MLFAVTAGVMDSMINATPQQAIAVAGCHTPDGRACVLTGCWVYSRIVKSLYPDVPLING